MRQRHILSGIFALAVGLLAGPNCAEARVAKLPLNIPGWTGVVSSNEQSRAFERCAATKTIAEGTSISYSVDHNYRWTISLSNPTWNFMPGVNYAVILKIGDSELVRATAAAGDKTTLDLKSSDPIAFFARFRIARTLHVGIGGLHLEFTLDGGEEIFSALTQCALRATHFAKSEKAKSAILDSHDAANDARQKEAAKLVANIVSYSHMPDTKIQPTGEEFAAIKADATWKTGLVTAHLVIFENAAPMTGIADALIARSFRTCQGGFFFLSLPDKINETQIERVFASCQTTETTISNHYLVIPRPKSGYYILAVTSTGSSFISIAHKAADEYEARLRSIITTAIHNP